MMKTLLHTQLKQTNMENQLHILTYSTREGFNDTIFQHFLDKLKPCKQDV